MSARSSTAPATGSIALHAPGARPVLSFLLEPVRRWLNRQAVKQELYSLDGRSLQDIGITKGDFPAILSGKMQRPQR